ncbi:MAG TPA: Gfo/Idh/MocA family oxidoreductase [Kouleothrix sp.]|uniref:Gfo/Idh/MocA family protein n=1 Tax=Kouleothrix sp. TaxID=2779161 RepID=UPI002C7935D0|nr:Gfo/Idh/MocA family oxidoreductase [Kouleothrix sp.]
MEPVRLIVLGAGSRGSQYARYAQLHPEAARIVAVAEPRDFQREQLAQQHGLSGDQVVRDWRALAERPRFADGAIIATQDAMHAEPAIALAERGYHILLEKPMAPSAAECRQIVAAVQRAGVIFAVCHVMRYTRYTQALKRLLDAGRVGTIVSMQHLEPVGFWHQAHSFVRGNWRNEALSSPMLLAKSCHDLDWIRYIMGRRCTQVSSFGSLRHFRASERPAGAADRCLECAVEPACPYSAPRFYLGRVRAGLTGWPVDVITTDRSEAGVLAALREGPYGRCVYACDNDVVDHQVVNMQFEDGATAAFTMTAFTRGRGRETHIFGTHGEIFGDGERVEVHDFLSGASETIEAGTGADGSILSGHGGGDDGLMRSFVAALARSDPGQILSGPDETLESHLMVFAAEQARHERRVVDLGDDATDQPRH